MIPALHAEWGKLCSLRSPWICLFAAVLLVPGTAYTLANDAAYDIDQGRLSADAAIAPLDIVGSSMQFGLAMFIAFAMLTITSEYATGSVRSTLLADPRRWRVLLAKSMVVSSTAALVGAAVSVGAYEVVELVLGDHVSGGASVPEVAIRGGVLVGLAAILVSGLASIVRSSVGTLALSFGILVGMLAVPEPLGTWLPARASIDWLTEGGGAPLAVLIGWAGAAWIAGWCVLERRDA